MKENIKILIIDDDPADRFLLAKDLNLRFSSAEIIESESTDDAFAVLEKCSIDVILLDYYLSRKDGLELLDLFDQKKIDIPIIVITGRGDERTAVEAIKRGAKDYLNKDFLTSERLEVTIKSVLESAAREKEKADLERKIEEALKRYQNIFTGAKETIFLCDIDGKLLDINPAGLELLGYGDSAEILNQNFWELVGVETGDKILQKIADDEVYRDYETILKKKNGEKIAALVTITVNKNKDGVPAGFQGIILDLTEKKRMEEELLQIQKLESLGAIAGIIAHDFNNIISSILVNSEIALRAESQNYSFKESIKYIKEAALKASSLSERLLSFARNQEPDFRKVLAEKVIAETVEIVRQPAEKQSIHIKINAPKKDLYIWGDPVQLSQLLLNLVVNSMEAIGKNGEIIITADSMNIPKTGRKDKTELDPGDYILVSVRDNGPGIDESNITKIFDPFYSTKKDTSQHVGLGLTSVIMTVKNHGGHLKVKSTKGKGTEFQVFLKKIKKEGL